MVMPRRAVLGCATARAFSYDRRLHPDRPTAHHQSPFGMSRGESGGCKYVRRSRCAGGGGVAQSFRATGGRFAAAVCVGGGNFFTPQGDGGTPVAWASLTGSHTTLRFRVVVRDVYRLSRSHPLGFLCFHARLGTWPSLNPRVKQI